jgi:serine/threonine protein kinase
MVTRGSAELASHATTAVTPTNISIHHVKDGRVRGTNEPTPAASPSVVVFDVLLVFVSVVSTLLVVTIVLLVVVIRLLRRVAAAHASRAHLYDNASHHNNSIEDEPEAMSSTTDDAQRMSDTVSEQLPLLQRSGPSPGQQVRFTSSPGLMETLRVVLGLASIPDVSSDAVSEWQRCPPHQGRRERDTRSRRRHDRHHPHHHPLSRPQSGASANTRAAAGHEAAVEPSASAVAATAAATEHSTASANDTARRTRKGSRPAARAQGSAVEHAEGVGAGCAAATVVASPAAATAATDGEEAMQFHAATQKDLVVLHTTHDSRYRLLQRIGMGAFSSVYLVQHKVNGQRYALKYIMCKDDRERLAALRECEVIHCLQGHPQVIRIVDMFMNYQFQRGGGSVGAAAPVAATSWTRHAAGGTASPAPPHANARPSLPWQVTSTANANVRAASAHAARSLTQSPSRWTRPVATPTSPLLFEAPLSSQQQQQPGPALCSSTTTAPRLRSLKTSQVISLGAVGHKPSSSTPPPLAVVSAHSTTTTPGSPCSPISSVAAATTGVTASTAASVTTRWVGVQLQGLDDDIMAKVANAATLGDAEVTAALRARMRTVRSAGGGGDDVDNDDGDTAARRRNRSSNAHDTDDEGSDAMGSINDDGGSDTDFSETDAEDAPLILSAADTERLLMDARLLQQRRHRQRQHRKLSAGEPVTAAAGALRDCGEVRSTSASSLRLQRQQQPKPQQMSVQHASRSSSAPHLMLKPCGGSPTLPTSSSFNTCGSRSRAGGTPPAPSQRCTSSDKNHQVSSGVNCDETVGDVASPISYSRTSSLSQGCAVALAAAVNSGDRKGSRSAPPPLQQMHSSLKSASPLLDRNSSGSSSGADEEPIQPICRVHVPPPSYAHPPPGVSPAAALQHNDVRGITTRWENALQPSSPTSYDSRSRYANFAVEVNGMRGVASHAGEDVTTPAAPLPSLQTQQVAGIALVDADVDAPLSEASTAAEMAKAAKLRSSYAPCSQQQQQQLAGSALSYAPASSLSSAVKMVSTYAPMRAATATAGGEGAAPPSVPRSDGGDTHQGLFSAVVDRASTRLNPLASTTTTLKNSIATKPTPDEAAASTQHPNTVAVDGPHRSALTSSSGGSRSSSGGSNEHGNTYAPARETCVGRYVNPYLERALGGEVVPPPRTSYAPGGGIRYNGLVAPSESTSAPQQPTRPASPSPYKGPVVRAWNDGSAVGGLERVATTTVASSALSAPMQPASMARNTYAPLRYGNLIQPPAATGVEPNESLQWQCSTGGASPVAPSTTIPISSGRMSVSAAIRSARAGQQGERMHLNDGKPHVHVPTPPAEGGLPVPPLRPFTNPNELNRTHVVHGHPKSSCDYDVNEDRSASAPHTSGNLAFHGDTAPLQMPPYMNCDVAPTNAGPMTSSAANHEQPTAAATAASHLLHDTTTTAPSYGATNEAQHINTHYSPHSSAAAVAAVNNAGYAPAVRYANAGNPTLWCAYGQLGGAAIGPASVASARVSAGMQREAQYSSAAKENADATSAVAAAKAEPKDNGDNEEDSSAAGTPSTTQSNSSGSLTQDTRDTGYLCLVMEYHPMGDLCHYVLRAKQQLALQRQQKQKQEQQQQQMHWKNSVLDSRAVASMSTPTPSDTSSAALPCLGGGGNPHAAGSSLTGWYPTGDPSSPTTAPSSSTTTVASWMVAAAAATWRIKPAASRSDPNLAMVGGGGGGGVRGSTSANPNANNTASANAARVEEEEEGEELKVNDSGGSGGGETADPTSRNPLTEPQLLSIAYQLSSVLDHMHRQSPPIIHRDLKPENILIKGELAEFLEDVPAEVVTGLRGVVSSHPTSKPASSPLSPAGISPANPRKGGNNSISQRHSTSVGGGVRADAPAKASAASPQTPCMSSNRGASTNTLASATAGVTATANPLLSPPPIRITRAIVPIVVTDFGLAIVQETHHHRHRGSRGGGTRPYIAPESWKGDTCTASDMWSLGCVLYALATGRLTARTVRLMSEEAKQDGFASRMLNDIINEKYSLAFASFVVSLLVVDPAKRPTAAQAAQCFLVTESEVRFDASSPFFSNVFDL